MRTTIVLLTAMSWVLAQNNARAGLPWADEVGPPRITAMSALPAREQALLAGCGEIDAALQKVAGQIASDEIAGGDVEAITYALRVAGDSHVWPRALVLRGRTLSQREARQRFAEWIASAPRGGRMRCGITWKKVRDGEVIAAVAVNAIADLERLPIKVRPNSWITVGAQVLVPATTAKVVAMGPSGPPRTWPTSFAEGRAVARVNLDQPGIWTLQVLVDTEHGPRPALETLVFVGVAPPETRTVERAPGEDEQDPNAEVALTRMVARARQEQSLAALTRDPALDRVARAHCEHMKKLGTLGHDVGGGDPRERLDRAGITAIDIGENVAHAQTVALAHRSLFASPSHRANLLEPRFARLGVGVCTGNDGTVWVTEAFATLR